MTAITVGEGTRERAVGALPAAAIVGAVSFVVASAWFGLIAAHISVSAPPSPAGLSQTAALTQYYTWFAGTLSQERIDTAIAIVGFACLAGVAWCVGDRIGGDGGRIGGVLVGLGSALWIGGNVMQLGGHRAVGIMATHGNPIATVGSIAFTIDTLDDAFELAAFATIAAGMIVLGAMTLRGPHGSWGRGTIAVGIVLTALAVSYVTGPDNLVDGLLVAGGVVMIPAWLVRSSRNYRLGD